MLLFVLLFASLLTGFIFAIIELVKSRVFSVLRIVSILNVILFILIFVFSK